MTGVQTLALPIYQGYLGAALVLGGVDSTGPHLYSIYPHGSTDKLPYVTMGESLTLKGAVLTGRAVQSGTIINPRTLRTRVPVSISRRAGVDRAT